MPCVGDMMELLDLTIKISVAYKFGTREDPKNPISTHTTTPSINEELIDLTNNENIKSKET
jgi:hypothetical protein